MLGKLLKLQLSQMVFSALFLILSTLFDILVIYLLMLLQQWSMVGIHSPCSQVSL